MGFAGFFKISGGWSIQSKLLVINLAATAVALSFAVVMTVHNEFVSNRDAIMESLHVQAEMVSNNTTAALVFNDNSGAEEVLQAFSASSEVEVAIIYNAHGNPIASYVKPGVVADPNISEKYHAPDLTAESDFYVDSSSNNNKVTASHVISFENEIIGSLLIQADISRLYDDIMNYLIYTSAMALIGLALASLLLIKLRKSIVHPLRDLTGLMDTVIKKNDYSIRAKNNSDDEIGVLSEYFNNMLAHIQINDERLEHELSERYKAEEHLDKLAYYDVTTDLPNRHFFQEHLKGAVGRVSESKQEIALLFLDLDDFKIINDTLGHKTGDVLLKQASSRLSNVLRQKDYICRIGGDEFAIILEGLENIGSASTVAEKCITALSDPFAFEGRKFFIGVSIGISICPDDAITSNDLLVNADMAMYEAKLTGKNNYKFFSRAMNDSYSRKYELLNDLRHAVTQNQMELYYQPLVSADSESMIGVEALMRWSHPEKGMISPVEFIPIAEESGLISILGEWLLMTACQQGKQLVDTGLKDLTVAVNISGLQIRDEKFIDTVIGALKLSGLATCHLELELTESTLMDDSELVIGKLKQLHALGISISIDDFGTGYSSMSYLKSFSINRLKIDRSFVSGLPKSSEDVAIARAIITMAHGMNISVVAEGVETREQVECLRSYGCDVLQGYHYAQPMPFNELLKLNHHQRYPHKKLHVIKGGNKPRT